MKKLPFLFGVGLFIAAPIQAQQSYPRAEIFGGYSYMYTGMLYGKSIPKGWNANIVGNLHRNIGIEADFSGHYVTPGGTLTTGFNHSTHFFMLGPRFAARLGRATPYAHALFGAAHFGAEGEDFVGPVRVSKTWFSWAVGGGLDVNLRKAVALRVFQADYVRMNGRAEYITSGHTGTDLEIFPITSNDVRLSFGVVLRLGGK